MFKYILIINLILLKYIYFFNSSKLWIVKVFFFGLFVSCFSCGLKRKGIGNREGSPIPSYSTWWKRLNSPTTTATITAIISQFTITSCYWWCFYMPYGFNHHHHDFQNFGSALEWSTFTIMQIWIMPPFTIPN